MVNAADVSAVLVTRGNVDIDSIAESLYEATGNIVQVWDNAYERDLGVYGRYAAIERVETPFVLVQDDDVILPSASIAALFAACEPRKITANMPEGFRAYYSDSCLVGFGAVFDRDLPAQAFTRWERAAFTMPEGTFHRCCDVIFTTLTPQVWVDVPYVEREFARDADRMYRQPEHYGERQRMLQLARQVRDRVTT